MAGSARVVVPQAVLEEAVRAAIEDTQRDLWRRLAVVRHMATRWADVAVGARTTGYEVGVQQCGLDLLGVLETEPEDLERILEGMVLGGGAVVATADTALTFPDSGQAAPVPEDRA
jgi:hypothetical protein